MSRSRLLPLVEAAVMIALTMVLAHLVPPLFRMPQGGKVTFASMVPILLVGLRHGPRWGVLAGLAAGLVDSLISPYIVHPVQYLLDYPIAFMMLGLAGLGTGKSLLKGQLACALALCGRMVAHVLSGVIFFWEYTPEGKNVWAYSIGYNASYMVPEFIISGVLLIVLLPLLQKVLPTSHGLERQTV